MHTWAKNDNMKKYNELFKVTNNDQKINKTIISYDAEAGIYIYNQLKHRYVCTSENIIYFKNNNIWINDKVTISGELYNYIAGSELYRKVGTKLNSYSQKTQNIRNAAFIVNNLIITNKDDSFYDKIHKTCRRKLCFLDGVLDIPTKVFTKWKDIPLDNQVYSTICINRNYNPVRNEEIIRLIYEKIFMLIFDKDADKILKFFSRAAAGEIYDKLWAKLIGNRNSGKGVIEELFTYSLGNYVNSINSNTFLLNNGNNAGTEDPLKYSWLFDVEFSRIVFSQEFRYNKKNTNNIVDGTTIKETFGSGGDRKTARKIYEQPRKIQTDGTLFIMCNDLPEIYPADTLEMCLSFNTTIQFVNQDFYNNLVKKKTPKAVLNQYKIGDNKIKSKVENIEWRDALIHLLLDYYRDEPVMRDDINELDDTPDLSTILMNNFQITQNKKDIITNDALDEWWRLSDVNVSLQKIKTQLISLGAERYKYNKIRGLRYIVQIIQNEQNELDELNEV
jgi:hypothetical protein